MPEDFARQHLGCLVLRRAAFYRGRYCIAELRSQPGSPIFDAVGAAVATMEHWLHEPTLMLRVCMLLREYARVAREEGGTAHAVCCDLGLPAVVRALEEHHGAQQSIHYHVCAFLLDLYKDPPPHRQHGVVEAAARQDARQRVEAFVRGDARRPKLAHALEEHYELIGEDNPFLSDEEEEDGDTEEDGGDENDDDDDDADDH